MAKISTSKLNFSIDIDLRFVVLALLVIIAGMFWFWKPWQTSTSTDRTIKVTGEATVKAEPDEFVFYPSYEFKDADKGAALAALTKKSDEVVTALKKLGVPEAKIKTNSSGYQQYMYYQNTSDGITYNLQLTVTTSKDLVQKVQDYLVSTSPTGSVSPQANFSDAKRKELESQARDQATKDARNKADQSAQNLGFKVGHVKSVEDGTGFGGIMPLGMANGSLSADTTASTAKLSVQPGENEINYTVTVTYFVR